jgi:predicted ATPase
MIQSISIKAFKSLLDVTVDLGRVNVFVGANGGGKSNLLEAIGVLGAAANGRVDDEALLRRGVRPGVPALYKSSFHNTRTRPSIRLEAKSSHAEFAVELNNPIREATPAWQFKNEILRENGTVLVGRSPASYEGFDSQRGLAALKAVELASDRPSSRLLRELAAFSIYSPNTNTLRGLTPDPQQREPVGLAGGRLPEAVLELLHSRRKEPGMKRVSSAVREMIDWASSYGSRKVSDKIPLSPSVASTQRVLYFKDRFMADRRNGLTGYDASEGALYVLFAAVLATLPAAPSILAIDNVDHGLNPRLARALMSNLCGWVLKNEADKQMLLTTHNPLVLDGLPLDNDDVRLFAVGRSKKGRTTVRRVKVNVDDFKRGGEIWTVSRLWVMGHLGGMPGMPDV